MRTHFCVFWFWVLVCTVFITCEAGEPGAPADAGPPDTPRPPADTPAPEGFSSNVLGIADQENFDQIVDRSRALLVMYYAPWCGHCKSAKPHFSDAADHVAKIKGEPMVHYAAVDCEAVEDLCAAADIKGYPTFKIFIGGRYTKDYMNVRTKQGFVDALLKEPRPPATHHEEL